jgi:hypothetical protein
LRELHLRDCHFVDNAESLLFRVLLSTSAAATTKERQEEDEQSPVTLSCILLLEKSMKLTCAS